METIVKITWDEPQMKEWLCADNIKIALSAYCKNTKFEVKAIEPTMPSDEQIKLNKMEETSKNNENAQLGIGAVVCNTWYATNQIRWKQKEVDMMDGTAMNINELQQMWQSDKGEQKWEAVPFVE